MEYRGLFWFDCSQLLFRADTMDFPTEVLRSFMSTHFQQDAGRKGSHVAAVRASQVEDSLLQPNCLARHSEAAHGQSQTPINTVERTLTGVIQGNCKDVCPNSLTAMNAS